MLGVHYNFRLPFVSRYFGRDINKYDLLGISQTRQREHFVGRSCRGKEGWGHVGNNKKKGEAFQVTVSSDFREFSHKNVLELPLEPKD